MADVLKMKEKESWDVVRPAIGTTIRYVPATQSCRTWVAY